ncbi:MAG: 16S rRNA (adenine(1518)-N(6)/adenine(1519)-N(6))-dimethyltransferase RsmA [Treponema sp.]|jgi:16S rRNA (adenine1518-N6/adenine1519-N6)-dimethyltransferase|nr:16S rRNA (adenine(1518)-N(6)/adenine(1519)-N(6))-dimethyltransferase RsmA [Treponema sp.]
MINYNSPSALKVFLEQEGLGMRKKFGQNFLINPQIRQSLVQALEAKDEVWEIGPGLGAMTKLLLDRGLTVKTFEIDNGFIRILKNIFSQEKNFSLVEGDVIKTWKEQPPSRLKPFLLGNLPYNIAAVLIADLIENRRIFSRMVVTVQKEVALRMTARAGSPDYSSFSVLCASAYKVKPLMLISRESFYPQPNVDSMGVLLENSGRDSNPDIFFPLVRSLFASRRKTVKNNLSAFLSSRIGEFQQGLKVQELCAALLKENTINEKERAENLELETFLSLAKSIDNVRILK